LEVESELDEITASWEMILLFKRRNNMERAFTNIDARPQPNSVPSKTFREVNSSSVVLEEIAKKNRLKKFCHSSVIVDR
jgi:hypothetical protein